MAQGTHSASTLKLIGFIVFIDMAGMGLVMPVMPSLITGLANVTVDRAAEIGGWLLFSYAAMQFLFAPVIGGLSDRFGRRPVLLATLTALGADYALMAWAPTLAWLFVGRVISGIMGATWAAANSCVADTVPMEDRGAAFGLLGGCGAAGFVLGPAIGGLAGHYGDRVPFLVASVLALGGAAVGLLILRETLPPSKRRAFSALRSNPVGGLIRLSANRFVIGCLAVIFLIQLAAQSQLSVWSYYGTLKFGWGPLTIGLTIALFGSLLVVAQGVLVGRAIARFGAARTALMSLPFGIPSYLLIAFAPSTSWIVIAILVGSLAGLTFPALQSLMTRHVGEDEQGELQGAIASTIGLTAILGPPLMTGVFGAFSDPAGVYLPGAPFLLAAALAGGAALWLARTLRGEGAPSVAFAGTSS